MSEPREDTGRPVRLLGFWGTPENRTLPDPAGLVDAAWEESERHWVSDYLDHGQVAGFSMGVSRCRLCACVNGSRDLTDGYYLWPEGLGHYVLDHGVRLPAEFVEHIGHRLQALEDLARDSSWWPRNAART
ncbi:hypothetical protein GCM10018781_67830 [Kitasatospora indigofera]|uniref:Uncharacterized protein n=1 Tax=Kitasatospora indigofera TaxID=67307 RepID=A0A919GDI7_9ACTN|nr:hypothetical protein [Kitasatospora indigofera]GHH82592.1 hypothetical protein GCM10018781_67830 [Kitasatospora indigofera]